MGLVELSRVGMPVAAASRVGGLRRVPSVLGRCVRRAGPGRAYGRYVTAGLSEPPESPWKEAHHGWIFGSGAFIDRVRAMVRGEPRRERRRESRLLQGPTLSRVSEVVCGLY